MRASTFIVIGAVFVVIVAQFTDAGAWWRQDKQKRAAPEENDQTIQEEEEEKQIFNKIDADGNGHLTVEELIAGLYLLPYESQNLQKQYDTNNDISLDINEFHNLYVMLRKQNDYSTVFQKIVALLNDLQTHCGSTDFIAHSVKYSERYPFAAWINKNLKDDKDCEHLLPLNPDSDDLYTKVKDGILLCKLIYQLVPDTIDERTINKKKLDVYLRTENHILALNTAQSIGCNIIHIGPGDIENGKPHLVLGLLGQIIRIGLLKSINLTSHPGLVLLLEEGETIDDLLKLSPEEILIRWVNYHLRNAGINRQIANFSGDIKDSEAYIYLLHQISPKDSGVGLDALMEPEDKMRAEAMLVEANKIGCRDFITSTDVVEGNANLNVAFVANLFNTYPALEISNELSIEFSDETREEKTYRNWMNSMGVKPHVNRLYQDLRSGLIIFQLYDICRKGSVDWEKVTWNFTKLKGFYQQIENCNYAVDLSRDLNLSLPGIVGQDIFNGNPTQTLALVWQLMKAYTMSILQAMSNDGRPIKDEEIVLWANEKMKEVGKKCTFKNFGDYSLSDSIVILNLIDSIAPKKVNWDIVKDGSSKEVVSFLGSGACTFVVDSNSYSFNKYPQAKELIAYCECAPSGASFTREVTTSHALAKYSAGDPWGHYSMGSEFNVTPERCYKASYVIFRYDCLGSRGIYFIDI